MTTRTTEILTENLHRIRERIEAACQRAGRSASDVTLVAVSKYAELDWVRALVDLGITDLGESRPQQLAARAAELPAAIRWHLIGHLQRNKVELVLPLVTRIHSVDSVRLLEAINRESQRLGSRARLLLEVNVSGEQSKDGFGSDSLLEAWTTICQQHAVQIDGLMTMAPLTKTMEEARPIFRALRELRDRLAATSNGRWTLPDLSMGMSGDFEIAIEEGATLVRVGSGLFEGLNQ